MGISFNTLQFFCSCTLHKRRMAWIGAAGIYQRQSYSCYLQYRLLRLCGGLNRVFKHPVVGKYTVFDTVYNPSSETF